MKNEKKPVRRASVYSVASKKKVELDGQAAIVLNAVKQAQPATMAQIADIAAKKLETKQEPIRVVNHYLQKFQAENLVRRTKKAA